MWSRTCGTQGAEVVNATAIASSSHPLPKIMMVLGSWITVWGLSGCVAVGYSSGGGWFVWPGGLGLFLIVILAVFILRRR
jgi:hypothetical protein